MHRGAPLLPPKDGLRAGTGKLTRNRMPKQKSRPKEETNVKLVSRAAAALMGVANYGNPLHILGRRLFTKDGVMTIVDRNTGVSVAASRRSYHMFSSTWYLHEYDVAGCPIRQNDVVVDVGANQGFFTCYAAQRLARLYSFEPHPKTFELLTRNIRSNGFDDRVTAECAAIADFEGEADLLCSTYLGGGADTLCPGHARFVNSSLGGGLPPVRVRVRRLASAIPSKIHVRLLKLDCEGAELAILRDLEDPERFDSIALECHPDAYRVDTLIETILNFRTHQVYAIHGQIIHAIRTNVLLEFAGNIRTH
jgi:FkbM family methyltransferase